MITKLYSLKSNLNFKNVFGRKRNLTMFLSEVFEEIEDFWYINKEYKKENRNLRYEISDIAIESKKERIMIKIQNQDLKNLEPRITMYFSNHYSLGNLEKNMKM